MKVSDYIINFFEEKGIDTAFTISGGGCIHLIDSLRKSKINVVCPHHEQTALMASEGYFRMKNKIALNVVTTGPGGTNTLTGLLGLWLDSIPSVIISGQVATSQLSEGTGCRQIGDQEFDIIKVVKPMTKYAKIIKDKNDIKKELKRAYKIATTGRPGPVWLDIPLDIQSAKIDDYTNLQELINESKKPLVVVGSGVRLSNSYDKLNLFLEKNNLPVVTGPHSGVDCVNNEYDYYCGRIGILGQITSNKIVQEADLLIILGSRIPVKMTGYNLKEFSPNSKKIYIDIDENEINKHSFEIDHKIVIDLNEFLSTALTLDFEHDIDNWLKYIKRERKEQIYVYPKHNKLKDYVSFYYFISKAKKLFKGLPIITSNGTAHVITLQTFNLQKDQRLFTNVGCASMGYGLPAAIGACYGNEKKPVICIEGDGSIMMNLQELQTVKGNNLPIKIILINNEGYLSIKMTQDSFFGDKFASGPDDGVTLPNFEKISKSFDIDYISIKNNNEIDKIEKLIDDDKPYIIEVFTHPNEKHEPKVTHKGIYENGKIIPGTLTDMSITEDFE
jgi:acetolactate synthase-1/2/3 large subunit